MYALMLRVVDLIYSALWLECAEASHMMDPLEHPQWVADYLSNYDGEIVVIGKVRANDGAVPGTEAGTVYFLSYEDNPFNQEFEIPGALAGWVW